MGSVNIVYSLSLTHTDFTQVLYILAKLCCLPSRCEIQHQSWPNTIYAQQFGLAPFWTINLIKLYLIWNTWFYKSLYTKKVYFHKAQSFDFRECLTRHQWSQFLSIKVRADVILSTSGKKTKTLRPRGAQNENFHGLVNVYILHIMRYLTLWGGKITAILQYSGMFDVAVIIQFIPFLV